MNLLDPGFVWTWGPQLNGKEWFIMRTPENAQGQISGVYQSQQCHEKSIAMDFFLRRGLIDSTRVRESVIPEVEWYGDKCSSRSFWRDLRRYSRKESSSSSPSSSSRVTKKNDDNQRAKRQLQEHGNASLFNWHLTQNFPCEPRYLVFNSKEIMFPRLKT